MCGGTTGLLFQPGHVGSVAEFYRWYLLLKSLDDNLSDLGGRWSVTINRNDLSEEVRSL